MYVDWIAYILLYVDWIDVDSECWWIVLKLIELYVIVEMCWFVNEIDNVIVMWIAIEKWWIEGDYEWLILAFDWFVLLLRMMWLWKMLSWEMRYWMMLMMKDWVEILRLWKLKFVEFDWIDELCELLVFDGNELIV